VDNGFKAVDKRFGQVEQETKDGFAKVDRRFEKVEHEMREGFARVDREMKERFSRVDKRFEKIEERLAQTPTRTEMNEGFAEMRTAYAALNRTLLVGTMAIVAALIGIVGALLVS
jgi:hypothetical protein